MMTHAADPAHSDADRLGAALLGAIDRCNAVLALAREQAGLIAAGDDQAIQSIASQREQAFEALVDAYSGVQPFAEQWDSFLAGIESERASELSKLADTLSAAAAEVQSLDDAMLQTLRSRGNELNAELRRIDSSRRAAKTYGPQKTHQPLFEDRTA